MPDLSLNDGRLALALNLELSHGRHGASARVEVVELDGHRVLRLGLRGWIESVAIARLEQALAELALHEDLEGLVLDGSHLRHVEFRVLSRLSAALARFEARPRGVTLHGLPSHLADLLRLAAPRSSSSVDALRPQAIDREHTS